MKLYESPSPNARRVHIFMAEKGLECDRIAVDIRAAENLSAEYLAKNPWPGTNVGISRRYLYR